MAGLATIDAELAVIEACKSHQQLTQQGSLVRQINTIIVQNGRHSRNARNLACIKCRNHGPKQIQQLSRGTIQHGRKGIQLFCHGGLSGLIECLSDEFKSFLGSGGDGASLKEEGG
jgi:hypothetical protein